MKAIEQYPRNRSQPSGLAVYCKPCHNARGKASKDKVGGSRTYHLKRRYGITAEEFDVMLAEQGGQCAVWRNAPAEHVDHDHETGAVRSLLCFNCNGGLGQFKDDPKVLRAAAAYVTRHRGEPVQAAIVQAPDRRSSEPADSERSALRRHAAGCGSRDIARARRAAVIASMRRPSAG